MAVKLVFYDKESELVTFFNANNKCAIEIRESDDDINFCRCIELDSNDLTELISELQSIKKQIDEWMD